MDGEAVEFLERHGLDHLIELFRSAGVGKRNFRYIRENLAELIAIVTSIDDRQAFVEAFDAEESSTSSAQQMPASEPSSVAPVSIRATLEEICSSSNEGKKFWARKQIKFEESERKMLAPLITQYFFDIGGGHISALMFEEMTAIILAEFPSEKSVTWYVKSSNSSTTKAQGKLVSSYRTLQVKKRKIDGAQKGAKIEVNSIPYNRTDQIMDCWDRCFFIRRHEIMSGSFDMNEYNVLFNYTNARDLNQHKISGYLQKHPNFCPKIPENFHRVSPTFS